MPTDPPRARDVGAAPASPSHTSDAAGTPGRRHGAEPGAQVRTVDLEPYTGLRYLSKLFRLMAIVLVLLLVAEVATGLIQQGADAIATLVAESSRLIVLAGLLWGIGDLVLLLIDVGHDVRAARILLGRQVAHHVHGAPAAATGAGAPAGPPDAALAHPERADREGR